MKNYLRCALIGLAFVATPAISQAQLLTNLTGGTVLTGSDIGFQPKAVGLSVGANPFAFTSLRATLNSATFSLLAGTATGGIYSSVGGNPGASLASFNSVNVPLGGSDFIATFLTGGSFTLSANTTYWFVLQDFTGSNGSNTMWRASDVAPTASAGVSFAGYRVSDDKGVTWRSSAIMNRVEINGTQIGNSVVPEPQTYAMLFVGLFGIAVARRTRRSV